ncbi:FMN-dependent NADH-azoreductase [Rhizobium ruizarguesonis]|uniref:FMN-dependent NADH-azoreductase n=1 Tax=Rhizobium TaxID=379 RepID=UPI00103D513B|nr:flavodoxin family protein [Rhizobium ruizarguesonis]NEI54133.1 flavodoxin family protein [Rhizobium leguminosarum]NEI82372.1 flavodoxin family protein [Rhizobium leguminosarum]TBZ08747.1 flavodoxin family protein [Rhizobium leguminosarum bv. viciae]
MRILHLICSPRGHASASASHSRQVIEKLIALDRQIEVTVRCLNDSNMPHIDREFSMSSRMHSHIEEPFGSRLLSDELIDEVIESEAIVLATPTHNLTIPSALKAWIDHVVRPNKTFRYVDDRMVGLLPDRPVFVSLSQGIGAGDGPDFLRPYLRTIFAAMGITSIEFCASPKGAVGRSVLQQHTLDVLHELTPETAHEAIYQLWSRYR